jgi:hypothetical protein
LKICSTDLKDKYAFIGTGVTKQGKIPEINADDITTQAIQPALNDAGMKKEKVDDYIFNPGRCFILINAFLEVWVQKYWLL